MVLIIPSSLVSKILHLFQFKSVLVQDLLIMPSTITSYTLLISTIKSQIESFFLTDLLWNKLDDYTDATNQYLVFSKQFSTGLYGTCFLRVRWSLSGFSFQSEIGTGYTLGTKTLLDASSLTTAFTITNNSVVKVFRHNNNEFNAITFNGNLFAVFKIANKNNFTDNDFFDFLLWRNSTNALGTLSTLVKTPANSATATVLQTFINGTNQLGGVDYLDRLIFISGNCIIGSSSNDAINAPNLSLNNPGGRIGTDYQLVSLAGNSTGLFLR